MNIEKGESLRFEVHLSRWSRGSGIVRETPARDSARVSHACGSTREYGRWPSALGRGHGSQHRVFVSFLFVLLPLSHRTYTSLTTPSSTVWPCSSFSALFCPFQDLLFAEQLEFGNASCIILNLNRGFWIHARLTMGSSKASQLLTMSNTHFLLCYPFIAGASVCPSFILPAT